MEHGDILGHEFMGVVEATGPGVTNVKRCDRVVIRFTISSGECFFCEKDRFAASENTNRGRGVILNKKQTRAGAGRFGYSHLYGGQDANVPPLPPHITAKDAPHFIGMLGAEPETGSVLVQSTKQVLAGILP